MARAVRVGMIALALLAAPAAIILYLSAAHPLEEGPAFEGELPGASPPAEMTMFQLPTGVTHRSAAFAYRGGSFFDKRDFAMTAVLIRHPQGDLLIDTGFGRNVGEQLALMPFLFRATTSYSLGASVGEQLDRAKYDRSKLRAVVLTHAHWDHTSGLGELAGTPVWVPAEERAFIANGGMLTAVARSTGATFTDDSFVPRPYLGFEKSDDVYGDGSVVIVPLPGHTPGSVAVFVTLPKEKRFAFIGDVAWQAEGITELEERPWIMRTFGDDDPALVRQQLRRIHALAKRFPQMTIVPAHEARAFDSIPRF